MLNNSEKQTVEHKENDFKIMGIDLSITADMTSCGNWTWQSTGVYCSKCHYKLKTTGTPRICPKCHSFMV